MVRLAALPSNVCRRCTASRVGRSGCSGASPARREVHRLGGRSARDRARAESLYWRAHRRRRTPPGTAVQWLRAVLARDWKVVRARRLRRTQPARPPHRRPRARPRPNCAERGRCRRARRPPPRRAGSPWCASRRQPRRRRPPLQLRSAAARLAANSQRCAVEEEERRRRLDADAPIRSLQAGERQRTRSIADGGALNYSNGFRIHLGHAKPSAREIAHLSGTRRRGRQTGDPAASPELGQIFHSRAGSCAMDTKPGHAILARGSIRKIGRRMVRSLCRQGRNGRLKPGRARRVGSGSGHARIHRHSTVAAQVSGPRRQTNRHATLCLGNRAGFERPQNDASRDSSASCTKPHRPGRPPLIDHRDHPPCHPSPAPAMSTDSAALH